LKIFGVTLAIFFSSLIPVGILFVLFSKKYNRQAKIFVDQAKFLNEFKDYSVKFFFATLGITLLTSVDILFVKHFFSPQLAGQYAALSVMGRAIFYLTSPIYFVFFPLIAQK